MPRASLDLTQPYAFEVATIANLKKNIPDVLPDFERIYKIQLKRFRDFLYASDADSLRDKIQGLKNLEITQTTRNRVYIVTNLDYTPFVLVDMDDTVVNHLIDVYSLLDIKSPDHLTPDFISTLFVFKGRQLRYQSDIRPHDVAQLTAVFKNENLYNFSGARYDIYSQPKRRV